LEELFIANVDLAGIDHEAVKRAEAKLPRNFDRVGGLYIPPVSPSTAGLLPASAPGPKMWAWCWGVAVKTRDFGTKPLTISRICRIF